MHGVKAFVGFVLGLLVAGGATLTFAQVNSEPSGLVQSGLDRGRAGTNSRPCASYAIAEVDEGAVRARTRVEHDGQTYRWTSETKNDPVISPLLMEATRATVRKQKLELLTDGYGPYAAPVYKGPIFDNEYCSFFRKQVQE